MLKDEIRTRLLAEIEDLWVRLKEATTEGNRIHKEFMGRLEIDGKLRREASTFLKVFGGSGSPQHAVTYADALERLRASEAITKTIDESRWANINENMSIAREIVSRRQLLEKLEAGEVDDLGLGRYEVVNA